MQVRIPAVILRGGTSKAIFFHENHLPKNPERRDRAILAAFGSPDLYKQQINGLGGATSTTNKVAIIGASAVPDYDVVYNFGQVSVDKAVIDYGGNCGNISSAVGPFAVDAGLVPVTEPITKVKIFQQNTRKLIIADVPVKNGLFNEEGEYSIDGIPGTGSRINLHFYDPAGGLTGKLFPTGNKTDILNISNVGNLQATIIDAGNPAVIVRASDIGLAGHEIEEIDKSDATKEMLEEIRCTAAVVLGLASTPSEAHNTSQAFPKIAIVSSPQDYKTASGRVVQAHEIDLVARAMSMGALHKSYAITGAIYTAGAALIPETIVNQLLKKKKSGEEALRIGHPGGIMSVTASIKAESDKCLYNKVTVGRTARRLMEGFLFIPESMYAY